MISAHFNCFLLVPFVMVFSSYANPIDMQDPVKEPQMVASDLTEDKETAYAVPEDFDGQDVNLLTGEGDVEEAGGAQDLQELSPNTADTMRKINPLTIADQVSQMFRKGSQKANLANKSGSGFRSPERAGIEEETHGDESLTMSVGPEGEDSLIQPGYLRQGVPKIVNKPRSNDYGYSVIVLAGDAVHLPIKVPGKTVRDQGKGAQEDSVVDFQKQDVYRTGDAEERINLEESTPKKEVRVYKQYSKNPDFPVYDEDLNFVPDPFQGILDENYRIEMGKANKKPVVRLDNFRSVNHEAGLHRVHIRSDTEDVKATGEKEACGSWGKTNSTQSEVIPPLTDDNSTGD